MHDLKQEMKRTADEFGEPGVRFEDVRRVASRRNGVRRVSAAAVALIVVAASGSLLFRAFDGGTKVADTGLAGTENGPISFTIAEKQNVPETSRIGIVDGPGSAVDVVRGFPDPDTGGWSPDGSQFVFSRGDELAAIGPDIWVADRDGTNLRQLTDGAAGDYAARFSPSGRQILFERVEDDLSPALMLIDADGQNLRQIAGADDEVIFDAAWSPGGTHILTIGHSGEGGDPNWLAVMDADGDNRRVLFEGQYNEPSWSADGTRILISSQSRLLVVPLDGGDPVEVLDGLDRQGLSQVEWSPDGDNILYTQPIDRGSRESDEELWVAPLSGDAPRLVAEGLEWRDPAPAWSPNGSAIAFVREGDIWTVDIDTGEQTQITATELYESNPAWGVLPESST